MGGIERVGNLNAQIKQEVDCQRLAVDPVLERLSLEIFHSEVGAAIIFADIIDNADIGMIRETKPRVLRGGSAPAPATGGRSRQAEI